MNRARIACFFKGHILERQVMPGYFRMPVRCRRCDYTESGIKYPPMPPIKPPPEPTAERVQIITAKAGDTIAVMSDAYMSANERLLLIALFQAKLPEGVKVMVLDRGMKLAHVEGPHIPQPTPERRTK